MSRRRAFSLVELLVVISLIALFTGLIALSTRTDERNAAVRGAAEELASVLRETRQRALREQVCYAVAFNIQNEPGSAGRVLNNRSGGHFYRVIGPAKRTRYPYSANVDNIPQALGNVQCNAQGVGGEWRPGNFPDFIDDVASSWRSDPYILPPRKVRFLALGDLDEGPRQCRPANTQVWYGSDGQTTYPRPWFGYFDPADKRLYPWGGYDPAIPGSGFGYQGSDGPIADSRNPTDLTVDHDWDAKDVNWRVEIANVDRNGDGDTEDRHERETAWPIWRAGSPRAVVNADWLDACLLFMPNGDVEWQEWNRARRAYRADRPGAVGTWDFFKGLSGIPSRAKPTDQAAWGATTLTSPWPIAGTQEVAHFDRHTSAYRITLGPDTLDDRDRFVDEAAAVASFTPAWTVSISRHGVVWVSRVRARRGYLDTLPTDSLWPARPADWLDASQASDGNPVARNCRFGWLHHDQTWWNDDIRPLGQPIVEVVDPRMLSRRIWWRR